MSEQTKNYRYHKQNERRKREKNSRLIKRVNKLSVLEKCTWTSLKKKIIHFVNDHDLKCIIFKFKHDFYDFENDGFYCVLHLQEWFFSWIK